MECHLSSVNDAADANGSELGRTEVAMASMIWEMSLYCHFNSANCFINKHTYSN